MKSKEEILENFEPNSEYSSYYHESQVLEAMELYVRQSGSVIYQVLEPVPPRGELEWADCSKEEFDKYKDCQLGDVTRILVDGEPFYGQLLIDNMDKPISQSPKELIKETDQEALREGYDVRDPKKWPPEKDGSYWCMIESSGHLIALGKRLVRVKYVKEEGGFVSEDGGFKIIYYLTIE